MASASFESTWLIAGLGNPGPEYEWTPHNVGFLALDHLAERHSIRISRPECQSVIGMGKAKGSNAHGERLILAKPQTFMNVSGAAIGQLLDKYELTAKNLIVVYDELALEWGHLRIRARGSAGGHNGMKSIISAVRTEEFIRVRLGINPGKPDGSGAQVLGAKTKNYVLAQIPKSMRTQIGLWLDESSSAIETIIAEGAEKAMTSFNRRASGSKEEEA